MTEALVINTGPLITLSRIECLELLRDLPFRVTCPEQVWQEVREGERLGHPRLHAPWVDVQALREPLNKPVLAVLDGGEAAVIQLALEQSIPLVAIDEWKGRRAAQAAGLSVTGTLGLLGRAKRSGLVSEVRPLLERAEDAGIWYHPDLVARVLETLGE